MDESVAVFPMDIHKRFSMATPMNREGEVLDKVRLEHGDGHSLQAALAALPPGTDVVMEATFNWPWIADLVQAVGLSPHLADPRETGRMRKGKPKSDGRDAIFLGKLWLGKTVFPEVYLAPPPVRRMRALCRQRLLLVRVRAAQKNNIHGHLHRLGIDVSGRVSNIFSPKGRRVLDALELDEHERTLLEHKLTVVDVLTALIDELQERILQQLQEDPRATILTSIPGIGTTLAYTMLAEMGQMERFPTPRALAAYAGVLPLANESADKDFGKRTGGRCNHFLRWAALEAVTGAVRASARLRSLHARVRARNTNTPGKARVAVARKLMELVYVLLARGQNYQEEPPPRPGSTAGQRSQHAKARQRRSKDQERQRQRTRGNPNRASQIALCARSA